MLRSFGLLIICYVGGAYSQTTSNEVTLWQFGTNRLAGGDSTAPLVPLGTASDVGVSTTYLYRVVHYGASSRHTSSRTIVASASGWVEHFQDKNPSSIQCNFRDANKGECFDPTTTTVGPPTPVILSVELFAPTFTSSLTTGGSQTPSPTPSPTATQSRPTSSSSRPPVGAIVGCAFGGLIAMCLAILTLWIILRRRRSGSANFDESNVMSNGSVEPMYPGNRRSVSPSRSIDKGNIMDPLTPEMPSYHFEDHVLHRDLRNLEYSREEKVPRPESYSALKREAHEESLRSKMDDLLERLGKLEERKTVIRG